ncbi:ABC transporter substrate-binding protein [Streptomyces albus]|uniref:ABC transporter substrate-binding protein n=1 Tax=Streptomyces albus TaxID=1888 RepID=UPI000691CD92|nr:ABC transporter substrate-binding protein [Streptomyces albus]
MEMWRPTRPVVHWAVGILVAALVLGLGAPRLYGWWQEREIQCLEGAEGVEKHGPDEECVGVTDGVTDPKFAFAGHLTGIQRKIGAENRRVMKEEKNYVTLAYMTSLTVEKDDSNSRDAVRRQLQGAYLAQYRANRDDLSGSPEIRLLVANTGSGAEHWQYTVDRLIALSRAERREERLLAVTGLGPSTDENKKAMKRLSEEGIAMVASTMSATNLTDIPGLVRVAPTNRDEARAASAFLKKRGYEDAVIVQDEAAGNLYARTLAEEFREVFPDKKHTLPEENSGYDASQPDSWEGELRWIVQNLCGEEPDVVYFAGRGKHLMSFINKLANRKCQQRDFTVMTGDDTTNLTTDQLREAAEKGVVVYYTGLAHPDMWEGDRTAVSRPSAAFFQEGGLMSGLFPSERRDDAQAMMAHDAVLTAITAVRMTSLDGSELSGRAVARRFRQLRGRDQGVEGASGFLSFRNNGDPIDRAVPVLKLGPNGHFALDDVIRGDDR